MESMMLGSDPEIFVENRNGDMIPAFEFLPAKEEAVKTEEGESVYYDGFQAEFSVKPSKDIKEVMTSIKYGLVKLLERARAKDKKAKLCTRNVVEVDMDYMASLPYHLTEFGCMPSFNIYDISGKKEEGCKVPYRFAGGHIHFGLGDHSPELVNRVMRALDAIVGVAGVSLFENFDWNVRREYYGLGGEFRLPVYPNGALGLEYRTLSNAWIINRELAHDMFDLARKIVGYAASGKEVSVDTGEVIETILVCDADKARKILERNKHVLDEVGFKSNVDLFKPAESSVPMDSIEKNWDIK